MDDEPTAARLRPDANPWNPAQVTVDNCEREPIHTPNAIQPHGALVAFEEETGLVLHASANLGQWFPGAAHSAVGRLLPEVLGEAAQATVRRSLATTADAARHQIFNLSGSDGAQAPALKGAVHRHQGLCIAEFERAADLETERAWSQAFRDTIEALQGSGDLDDLVQHIADHVKRLTGFGRVMVYRFAADWHGEVIAEARAPGTESYFQMHFPAGDIPPQARALFCANLVRYIPDARYVPIAVLPAGGADASVPLDMSFAILRGVSPMCLQFLSNMGVCSTLTISLLVDGALWGLISCHHTARTSLPLGLRTSCNVLAVTAGYMLSAFEQRERAGTASRIAGIVHEIGKAFRQVRAPLTDVVAGCASPLLHIVGATAGALWQGDKVLPFGRWPTGDRGAGIVALVRRQLQAGGHDIVSTEQEALLPALDDDQPDSACGLMALRLDPAGAAGIVWLRPEFRHRLDWSGDPEHPKTVALDPSGTRTLSPRASFERWERDVRGHCRPWDDGDHAAARLLLPLQQTLALRATFAQIDVSDRRFSDLVELQSDTYWQTNPHGRLRLMSKPLPGVDKPAEGLTLPELLASSCDATSVQAVRDALAGNAPIRALRVRGSGAGGAPFELQLNGERMIDRLGHSAGWHGTITDMTQEVAALAARRERDAAEQLGIERSRFLAQVSHELQTPLTTVVGFSELLLLDEQLPPRQREPLVMIQTAGTLLQAMIADLLDLARIDAGKLRVTLAPTDIRSVLGDTIALVRFQAQANGVRFRLDEPVPPVAVRADPLRLKQVLLNLATNAVKYSNASSEVRISVTVDRPAMRVDIAVRDAGIGMSPAQREKLFQPFERLGREHGRISGTGIGLALVKHLVDAMGGKVVVTSEPDQGSCFCVSLELVPATAP